MLFARRIREAFASIHGADWILLALETVSVVAGILIAFALNEWASRRHDAEIHQRLMERLFEESAFDVVALGDLADSMAEIVKKEATFEAAVESGRCPPQADWGSVGTHGLYPAIVAPTSVYQELMNSGGLSAVDNGDVRIALAEFHSTLDWVHQQVDYFRDARIEVIDVSDPRITIRYDPAKTETIETYDTTAICADRQFRNRLAAATRMHTVFAGYARGAHEGALATCAALGEDLGKDCAEQFPKHIRVLSPEERKIIDSTVAKLRGRDARPS